MKPNADYGRSPYPSPANSNRFPQIRQRLADSTAAVTVSNRSVQTDGSSELSGIIGLSFEGIKVLLDQYVKGTDPEQGSQENPSTQPTDPSTAQNYSVRLGDTLLTIATTMLGDGARWKELWELNKGLIPDPNRVIPGMVLKLPNASAPAVPATPQPEPAPPETPQPSEPQGSGPLLKLGSSGDAVSKLQARLLELGCDPGGVDGIMGPNTVNAVKNFQASKGLEADGIVGPNTWKQLGIVVEDSVSYPGGDSDELIDIGGPQPAVRRQGQLIGVGIAAQFDAMVAAAAADGVELRINSGYRTHAEQQALWDENPDPTYVAYPGTSNHEMGNAIDFENIGGAWDWLANNAPNFGLYNYAPEPWHYSIDGG